MHCWSLTAVCSLAHFARRLSQRIHPTWRLLQAKGFHTWFNLVKLLHQYSRVKLVHSSETQDSRKYRMST
ncbi:hypothetical protein CesoFtcFv8_014075 [Champsocephalus esox]|uniref:Uncharacterized protein n=1 Tax=Champsocephalus esox TaxID=159716 RepID=A0AAN8BSZ9_9TELE|nr:hypothetical protein CesoFtcFv8_014075 [Champsocephalus esox]